MNQEDYRKLISGRTSGFTAVLLRLFLGIAAGCYTAIIRLRNFLYSKRWLKIHRANAVVFSIGNITVGGTGKTPLVIWLCRFLQNKNIPCAILTRGYKARGSSLVARRSWLRVTEHGTRDTVKDEPAILAQSCPGTEVIVNPDRVAGAAEAVNKFGAKVLIMDDGFQHRRLNRDADIVTIDATCPFGYGKMLPAGLLREPVASLKRAGAVVITRCDQADEEQLTRLEEKLRQVNPDMVIARSIHAAVCAKSIDNREIRLEELRGKRIFAFCGIGNPDAFASTIKGLGGNVVDLKIYDDHHQYTDPDIADICKQAGDSKADLILSTQKDWSKIITDRQSAIPLAYLEIELKFIAGEDKLRGLIEDTLAGRISQK